ncbi:hypothetical protein L7F22_064751 [Adiantum nelumboides]|nr:hypothetical protein [Adiantum nelumboides]
MVDAWCVGYYKEEDAPSRRLARPLIFCRLKVTVPWKMAMPDLWRESMSYDVKPLHIIQPEGPSFRVNGKAVEWQKWNFRIGFTPKEGLVIHCVAYNDGSLGRRSIAHRMSFVEMVVPYGDPKEPHYRKNAFDAGEDGLGKNAHL